MVAVLLALGLFIVLLQLGMMALVRRLAQQIEIERARVDKLERHLSRERPQRGGDDAPASRLPAEPAPEPAASAVPAMADAAALAPAPQLARSSGAAADMAAGDAARVDPAQLRGEMLGLMRQLVDQGLSVRDIAARCGLSEAEAELMLSLHGSEHG